MARPACWVVVLGDFGRSPRMQYHAASLSQTAGYEVFVIAYGGAAPVASVAEDPHIHLCNLAEPGSWISRLPRALALVLKALQQALTLLWALAVRVPRAEIALMQCPPAIPTMALCLLTCWLRGCRLIIDWHNFAYSLLAIKLGSNHPFVRLSLWYERRLGQLAGGHFCVTSAMQRHLAESWGVKATVLHDCPPEHFRASSLDQAHDLFMRLGDTIDTPMHAEDCCTGSYTAEDTTPVTEVDSSGSIRWREGRPAVVVSSTSWTPDEDFSLLLEAACEYDRRYSSGGSGAIYPRLLIIVTGRGPMKEDYCRQMAALRLSRVAFRTAWLEPRDYPTLLGAADVGVSLHTSSSGLDLPMKVVDMFGCSLPVCSADYSCIQELVTPDVNGLLFSSSDELADCLMDLFQGFPQRADSSLKRLRQNLQRRPTKRWTQNWREIALPEITLGRGPY